MAYARGNRIVASDYNTIIGGQSSRDPYTTEADALAALAGIWGVGYGRVGYNQNVTYPLDLVQAYQRVDAVHWRNLQKAVESCLLHQGKPTTDAPPASFFDAGDRVLVHDGVSASGNWGAAIAQIATGTNSRAMDDPTLYQYQGPLPMSYVTDPSTVVYADVRTESWGGPTSSANPALSFDIRVEFESGDHARAFFNAGCEMIIRYTYPTASTAEELEWKNLFENVFGDLAFGRDYLDFRGTHTPGSLSNPTGYWNVTSPENKAYDESPLPGLSNPNTTWMWIWQERLSGTNTSSHGDNGHVFRFGWAFFARADAPDYAPGVQAEVFANVPKHLPDPILPVSVVIDNPIDP